MAVKQNHAELGAALEKAINADSYQYLLNHSPALVDAIESELRGGHSPSDIRWFISAKVGPDRQPIALRCEQAARYILTSMEE
jgi:hypothetical protein